MFVKTEESPKSTFGKSSIFQSNSNTAKKRVSTEFDFKNISDSKIQQNLFLAPSFNQL